MDVPEHRRWMYNRTGPQRVGIKDVFVKGVDEFIAYACQSETTRARNGTIRCPCVKCKCKRFAEPDLVKLHLYKNGFKEMYGYWTSHGEMLPPLHREQSNDQTTCDEDYQEQCNQNEAMVAKRNKASSKGGTSNTGGCIPFSEHRRLSKEMESNSKPNLVDTFRRTHKRKDTDEFVDHKSAMAYAEYDDIDEVSRDNACWIEAMGGRNKRGRIFGVGSETKTIQSSSSRTSNKSLLHPEFQHELERCLSSYIEVANKEKELLQRELAKKEELLKRVLAKTEELLQRELAKKDEQLAKKDEQLAKMDEQLAKMDEQLQILKNYDAQFQAIFSRLNVHPTPINPNDEDQQRPTRH